MIKAIYFKLHKIHDAIEIFPPPEFERWVLGFPDNLLTPHNDVVGIVELFKMPFSIYSLDYLMSKTEITWQSQIGLTPIVDLKKLSICSNHSVACESGL